MVADAALQRPGQLAVLWRMTEGVLCRSQIVICQPLPGPVDWSPLGAFLLVEVGGARYRLPLGEFRPQGVQVLIHKFECVWSQQQMRWGSR